jgi:hypothetical protein
VDDITLARVQDPGRGFFCAVTKRGEPLNAPPRKLEPIVDRVKNPRGVRHPFKTQEDNQPKAQRRRYQEWEKRQ